MRGVLRYTRASENSTRVPQQFELEDVTSAASSGPGRLLGMPDMDTMLEAHVQFELDQFTADRLGVAIAQEASAAFTWLESVPLSAVITPELVDDWVGRYVFDAPISDEVAEMISGAVRAAHNAALHDKTPVAELLPVDVYEELAQAVIGMKEIRQAITNEITTSEVYSRLISHVLYYGIKNYLLTESVIARKVPGASSLMRLGQSALSSAAPNLEKSIDRQLTAFVNTNIQDSIRESRHYLDKVLDDELLSAVAAEVWKNNADSTLADAAALLSNESLERLVESGKAAWLHLRSTPTVREILGQVTADFLDRNGDRPIANLLADVGITSTLVSEQLTDALTPVVARALDDGYLEVRIRARLGEFYSTYDPGQKNVK